jgi:L-aspartate oxidase
VEPFPPLERQSLVSFESSRIPHRFTDVLVVGSGVAGLSAALAAARHAGTNVLLVAKDALDETATRYAQGGVAAVMDPAATGDSLEAHIADTLEAGHGLCDPEAVRILVTEGVERVRELIALGTAFDRDEKGKVAFTLEGGHTFPRILHRGDTTGEEVQRALLDAVRACPNVTALGGTFAVDLLTRDGEAAGAILSRPDGELEAAWAARTVLASGGLGRLYRETTNPRVATSDGVAMAFRAGAVVADLEFVQFHPTTLYLAGAERFLITEAVRGEGGVLRDGAGNRFMARFHPRAELAPRDVVSRGILTTLRERGESEVFLDLSTIPPERVRERFPRILEILAGFGVDILRQPIPVRPSAHYAIGGVRTDLEGRTSLKGLFAAGEVASSGVHGANRLASNSLLEGLVFGHRAGSRAALEAHGARTPAPFSVPQPRGKLTSLSALDLEDLTTSLRSLLWRKVGLERDGVELAAALAQIGAWVSYGLANQCRDPGGWMVQNMLLTSYLLTLSALRREESRGVHFRLDHPEADARFSRRLELSRKDLGPSAERWTGPESPRRPGSVGLRPGPPP